MEILISLVTLAVGFIAGYLIAGRKSAACASQVSVLESRLTDAKVSASSALSQAERAHERILADRDAEHQRTLQRLDAAHRQSLDALQERFDETVDRLKAELEAATADMLRRREEEFAASSRKSVAGVLEPLNNTISEMRSAVSENTRRHAEFSGQLTENIRSVMEHSDAARISADRLADALRGGGKIQGDWGETVLTELLESQGLTEGVHFDTQTSFRSDNGTLLRPDVVLHLDHERDVVIDSKVSLSAYIDYMNAATDEHRAQALKAHVASVQKHVDELAAKNYSAYISPGRTRIDYVIMFVPCTAALYAATSQKTSLWRDAMDRGVYIADEQTLYAALRIINMTWRQIAQAENHEKVFKCAYEMLDRVAQFLDTYNLIGTRLADAQAAFEKASKKLQASGQSIPQTCRKLQDLGARSARKLTLPDSHDA